MTRTNKLAEAAARIYNNNKATIDALDTLTPAGGRNAAKIDGWVQSPDGVTSRACNIAGVTTLPWWSGSAPTPSTAIPMCMYDSLVSAKNAIWNMVAQGNNIDY